MSDIRNEILSNYEIDINQENIFDLYKMKECDISPENLNEKIQETHRRWSASINGPNERNAARDRERQSKAEKYEKILKDARLRKAVWKYYMQKPAESVEFAREYFKLVATTKKVRKSDVDFFFQYYKSERKKKKPIQAMLNDEMKIRVFGKEENYEEEQEQKGKKEQSPIRVSLFQKSTILKIRDVLEHYKEATSKKKICERYPKLQDGLYEYLELDEIADVKDFVENMSKRGKEVYAVQQEMGNEYSSLADLFTNLKELGEYPDVADNMEEFKLLLKYPDLTPYMFAFVEMKPQTLAEITKIASREYKFRDESDFLLNYYMRLYRNFGISNGGINRLIHRAEKNTKENKILKKLDKVIQKKAGFSFGARALYLFAYFPVFLAYFVFEIVKTIFTRLYSLVIPVFVVLFVLFNWFLSQITEQNILTLRKIFFKTQWMSYLQSHAINELRNGFDVVMQSLISIIIMIAWSVLPPLFVSLFFAELAKDFNKRFDWNGIERTWKESFSKLKDRSTQLYALQKQLFIKRKLIQIAINSVCIAAIVGCSYLIRFFLMS